MKLMMMRLSLMLTLVTSACHSARTDNQLKSEGSQQLSQAEQIAKLGGRCAADLKPTLLPAGQNLRPLLCDEFDKSELNANFWSYNYTWGDTSQLIGKTRVHNFVATMDESMVSVQDGSLILSAANKVHPTALATDANGVQTIKQMPNQFCKQLKNGDKSQCSLQYTTGAVTSRMKFRYGYLEARMRLPATHGMWPAFWMLHEGWPPEIDILEVLTNYDSNGQADYKFSQNYHYQLDGYRSAYKAFNRDEMKKFKLCLDAEPKCGGGFADWQVYGVKWTPEAIKFYINGQYSHGISNKSAITSKPGYILLNLGVGGWAENPDERTDWTKAKMEIDWVRLWELPEIATEITLAP